MEKNANTTTNKSWGEPFPLLRTTPQSPHHKKKKMVADGSDKNRRSDQEDDRKFDQDNGNGNGEYKDRLDAKHPKQKT